MKFQDRGSDIVIVTDNYGEAVSKKLFAASDNYGSLQIYGQKISPNSFEFSEITYPVESNLADLIITLNNWAAGNDFHELTVDIAADIHAATSKATPVDADEIGLVDSVASWALKKLTWANVKATLKIYFDGLYPAIATVLKLNQTTPQTITNDTPIFNTLTASELVATTAAKKLQTLAVATYPSLTELAYVKGVTSAIQTQINLKASLEQYKDFWIDASEMTGRVTNGAAGSTEEYATNDIMMDYYLFDSATEEGVQFKRAMPDDWDLGTIKVKFYWDGSTGASAGDLVSFGLKAGAISNDDAIDAALGTQQVADDVLLAVGDLHITPATPAITVGGTPVIADMIVFQIIRNVGGNDNMTEDAKLLGIRIQYKTLTTTSAAW